MLTISPRQIRLFEQAVRQRHIDSLHEQLRDELPDHLHAIGTPAALVLIADGLERAVGHGLTSLAGATVFVKLLFVLGERFDSDPALPCAEVLAREGLDEPSRIAALLDALSRHARSLSTPEPH